MFAVLFLSRAVLVKGFGYICITSLFSNLKRIATESKRTVTRLSNMHAHTCTNPMSATLLVQSTASSTKILLAVLKLNFYCNDISPCSAIYLNSFHAAESYCMQRKENDNVINLFPLLPQIKTSVLLSGKEINSCHWLPS